MSTTGMLVGEWFWEEAYNRTKNLSIATLKFSLEMLQVYEDIYENPNNYRTRLEEQLKREEKLSYSCDWEKMEESFDRQRDIKKKLEGLQSSCNQEYARNFKEEDQETEKLMSLLGQHVRSYLYSSFIPKPPIIEDEIDIINTLENIKKDEQLKEMLSILLVDYELREKVEKEQQKIINEILKINKLLKKKMDDMKNLFK